MPKNQVSDPITDQEIAFAHLVLSGTMTDRRAAEAVGLNPDTAAYTKAKPRVRAYMVEHRAAVHERLVQQETDPSRRAVEGLRRLNLGREQVLARLWEIANLSPEMTRGSVTGQVKSLAMIVAIEGLIPDRRAGDRLAFSSEKKSAPPPNAEIYAAAWLRQQQGKTTVPQPSPDPVPNEDGPARPGAPWGVTDPPPACPACPGMPRSMPRSVPWSAGADAPSDLGPAPGLTLDPGEPISVHPLSPSKTTPSSPYARVPDAAPDNRVPFSIKRNPFARRR
jgi:hypothetical protein